LKIVDSKWIPGNYNEAMIEDTTTASTKRALKNPTETGLALGFGVLVLLVGTLRGRLLFQALFEPTDALRQTLAQLRQLLWAKQDQSDERY
jgi:hypothetical protein